MPATLEDTVDFKIVTLNDLLEADAVGSGPSTSGEGKYRRWAMLSTAAAGLFAILFVVALVTGGGDDDGGGKGGKAEVAEFEGRSLEPVVVDQLGSDIAVGTKVSVFDEAGTAVVSGVPVANIKEPESAFGGTTVEVALTDEEAAALRAASGGVLTIRKGGKAAGTATTAPSSAPAPAPPTEAPLNEAPAPTEAPAPAPPG